MTNDEISPNDRNTKEQTQPSVRHSDFVIPSSLDICHSSFLYTRTGRPLSEIISDSERTHRFQEGDLPCGLQRPRAPVRQAISLHPCNAGTVHEAHTIRKAALGRA